MGELLIFLLNVVGILGLSLIGIALIIVILAVIYGAIKGFKDK